MTGSDYLNLLSEMAKALGLLRKLQAEGKLSSEACEIIDPVCKKLDQQYG